MACKSKQALKFSTGECGVDCTVEGFVLQKAGNRQCQSQMMHCHSTNH